MSQAYESSPPIPSPGDLIWCEEIGAWRAQTKSGRKLIITKKPKLVIKKKKVKTLRIKPKQIDYKALYEKQSLELAEMKQQKDKFEQKYIRERDEQNELVDTHDELINDYNKLVDENTELECEIDRVREENIEMDGTITSLTTEMREAVAEAGRWEREADDYQELWEGAIQEEIEEEVYGIPLSRYFKSQNEEFCVYCDKKENLHYVEGSSTGGYYSCGCDEEDGGLETNNNNRLHQTFRRNVVQLKCCWKNIHRRFQSNYILRCQTL